MTRRGFVVLAAIAALGTQGCAQMPSDLAKIGGWTPLIDGDTGLDQWHRLGDANWRAEDGAIVAYRGKGGFLVSKNSYKDFQLLAEFWADATTNSGVFLRVSNPKRIGADNAYEVNIKMPPALKAGGKWNTLEITARGQELTVLLNGVQTVSAKNARFAQGPVALQYGIGAKNAEGGPIKWRKVLVKPLDPQEAPRAAQGPTSGGGGGMR